MLAVHAPSRTRLHRRALLKGRAITNGSFRHGVMGQAALGHPRCRPLASGLSGAPRIAQGRKPSQGVTAIDRVMHQEAFDEGAHLISPRERETETELCSFPNDRSSFPSRQAEVSIASPLSTERIGARCQAGTRGRRSQASPLRFPRPDHRRAVRVLDLDPVPRRPDR
jgi:hypothetical protein